MPLDDFITIECGIVAIRVSRVVRRAPEPTVDVLLLDRDGNGDLTAEWSTMTLTELDELRQLVDRVTENAYRREFGEETDGG